MRKARTKSRPAMRRPGSAASASPVRKENSFPEAADAGKAVPDGWIVAPGAQADALAGIITRFRSRFPAEWERLRLCPLQHGLETIGTLLRAARPRG